MLKVDMLSNFEFSENEKQYYFSINENFFRSKSDWAKVLFDRPFNLLLVSFHPKHADMLSLQKYFYSPTFSVRVAVLK